MQKRQLPDIGMLFLNLTVRRAHLVSDSLNEVRTHLVSDSLNEVRAPAVKSDTIKLIN